MKKILFSDMDGTIIENNKPINIQDVHRVHQLREAGHYFVFCTGRNIQEAKLATKHFEYDYLVLNNGAMIVDNQDNVIYHQQIDNQDGKDIISYCLDKYPNLIYTYFDGKETIGYHNGQTYLFKDSGLTETNEYDFISGYQNMQDNFDIICAYDEDGDTSNVLEIQNYLNNKYPNTINGTLNVIYLDITRAHCSKGTGLLHLSELINEEVETYCIGDSYNDYSMFEVANHAYTFNRVDDEIKSYSDDQVDYVYQLIDEMLEK